MKDAIKDIGKHEEAINSLKDTVNKHGVKLDKLHDDVLNVGNNVSTLTETTTTMNNRQEHMLQNFDAMLGLYKNETRENTVRLEDNSAKLETHEARILVLEGLEGKRQSIARKVLSYMAAITSVVVVLYSLIKAEIIKIIVTGG